MTAAPRPRGSDTPPVVQVECPHCRARPGVPCRSVSGKPLHNPHASRYEAAHLPTRLAEENT